MRCIHNKTSVVELLEARVEFLKEVLAGYTDLFKAASDELDRCEDNMLDTQDTIAIYERTIKELK